MTNSGEPPSGPTGGRAADGTVEGVDADAELDAWLALALAPTGRRADLAASDMATAWLVDHAELAHPRVVEILDRDPVGIDAPAIVELLPAFGRAADVPRLVAALRSGDELLADTAGVALGRHPAPEARAALLRGLGDPSAQVAAGVAAGLLVRGDATAEHALRAHLDHADRTVRYRVVRALDELGCLAEDERERLARDPDEDIRSLF